MISKKNDNNVLVYNQSLYIGGKKLDGEVIKRTGREGVETLIVKPKYEYRCVSLEDNAKAFLSFSRKAKDFFNLTTYFKFGKYEVEKIINEDFWNAVLITGDLTEFFSSYYYFDDSPYNQTLITPEYLLEKFSEVLILEKYPSSKIIKVVMLAIGE